VAADKAQKLGKTSSALEELDDAIRVEPSSKLPWLRKAQIYFDARQYGQAITAAQEVLQRDASDLTAKSILAVSGLRVSAQALEQLRKANEVSGSARSEAESVAKVIREALGEPILVGSPVKPADTPRSPGKSANTRAVSTARSTAQLAVPPPAAGPAKTTASASGGPSSSSSSRGNNPFGALQ
jgi:tetratricopeptide (TPR) repeat protein